MVALFQKAEMMGADQVWWWRDGAPEEGGRGGVGVVVGVEGRGGKALRRGCCEERN